MKSTNSSFSNVNGKVSSSTKLNHVPNSHGAEEYRDALYEYTANLKDNIEFQRTGKRPL